MAILPRTSRLERRSKPRPPNESAFLPVASCCCSESRSRRMLTNMSEMRVLAIAPGANDRMVMAQPPSDPHEDVEHVAHRGHDARVGAIGRLQLHELRHLLVDVDAGFFRKPRLD